MSAAINERPLKRAKPAERLDRFCEIFGAGEGIQPSTPTLARLCSTPELHPHPWDDAGRVVGAICRKPHDIATGLRRSFSRIVMRRIFNPVARHMRPNACETRADPPFYRKPHVRPFSRTDRTRNATGGQYPPPGDGGTSAAGRRHRVTRRLSRRGHGRIDAPLVLVDFWAPWCGPCKQLGPVLEKFVKAARGKIRLAKMNIDEHPQIAQQLGIQSIPAVVAFQGGQMVDGFVGALPESEIKAFIERCIGPRAEDVEARRRGEAAGAGWKRATWRPSRPPCRPGAERDPNHVGAQAGLARLSWRGGKLDEAKALLDAIPPNRRRRRRCGGARRDGAGGAGRRRRRSRLSAGAGRKRADRPSGALRPRGGAQRRRARDAAAQNC